MTIIKIEVKITFGGNGNRKYIKKILHLKCDECKILFTCSKSNLKNRAIKQENHFCSKKCSSLSIKNGSLRNKIENGFIKKYGYKSYMHTKKFKKHVEDLCMKQYGVKSRLESKEILKKISDTCTEKYGTRVFVGSEIWKSKMDFQKNAKKAWETRIRNGSCSKSKPEENFYNVLCKEFGIEDIKRQIPMIRQWIDFYIVSLDLYVQLDGIYWHGLNRDINTIKNSSARQDKKIYKNYLRDQKLNKYTKENNIKMLRITDEKFNKMTNKEVISMIRNFNGVL